jgi:hypothetical protein
VNARIAGSMLHISKTNTARAPATTISLRRGVVSVFATCHFLPDLPDCYFLY